MAERWHEGIWLGHCFQTGEHLVAMRDGKVVKARAVKERPANTDIKWEDLQAISQPPSAGIVALKEGSGGEVGRRREEPDGEASNPGSKSRGVNIRPKILEDVGYTEGCPRCRALKEGDASRVQTSHHSAACRKRVEEKMMEIPKWRREVEAGRNINRGKGKPSSSARGKWSK